MKQYKISSILIYTNDENTIKDCIDGILCSPFPNVEVICVNNGSTDDSENIVRNIADVDDRVKLIKLPKENDINTARQAGLGIASGKFVLFINPDEKLKPDFVKELYYKPLTDYKIENNRLYRRVFLENDEEILDIVNKQVEEKVKEAKLNIDKYKESFTETWDDFQKITADNIKNSTYELTCRFDRLEKVFYEKDYEYKQCVENAYKPVAQNLETNNKQIYEDISKTYDYINAEINKKGCEINKLYEELSKNYKYTEDLVSQKFNNCITMSENDKNSIYAKTGELEKEIIIRYVNLKRLLDMRLDELSFKLQNISGDIGNNSDFAPVEKTLSENLDNIYSVLNETSASFYKELSNIYKEMNEKLIKQKEDERHLFEEKLSGLKTELQEEFNKKLEQLKEEISK